MGKKGKLEVLESRLAELDAAVKEHIAERERLAQEQKALRAVLRGAEPGDRGALREELKDLAARYNRVKAEEQRLADQRSRLQPKVISRRRQLRDAKQVVDRIADPPPWMKDRQSFSPHSLRQLERRARRTIRELMG